MVFRFIVLILLTLSRVWAQAGPDQDFGRAAELFVEGKYRETIQELNSLKNEFSRTNAPKSKLARLFYWKGITYARWNEFPEAIKNFDLAMKSGFQSPDIHYELGQALFAQGELKRARAKFARSYKIGHKKAVSLYYIAYISQEMRDFKKAFKYYQRIEKLPPKESSEVLQAARYQIADILYQRAQEHPDSFRMLESIVLPQYEKALQVDEKSALAGSIKNKIYEIQKRYDLLIFQLRNGRPVLFPPYFLKISQELGYDSNVIFNPNETTISRAKQASEFTRTDVFGRYTFYYHDYFSVSPELRFNNTYYFNREPEIYRNDNRVYAGAIRNAYEFDLRGRPASLLFDIEYNEVHRDIRQRKKLQYNSSAVTYMIGQRLNFWDRGDTVFRLRHRNYDSYSDFSDSKSLSFSIEQAMGFRTSTFLFYGSLDRTRTEFDIFDSNSFTTRIDYIFSGIREYVVPVIGLGVTRIDPINDRTARGIETLVNPTVRLIKNFGKNWRVILKYDKQDYDSRDTFLFAYKKETYGMELEYLF